VSFLLPHTPLIWASRTSVPHEEWPGYKSSGKSFDDSETSLLLEPRSDVGPDRVAGSDEPATRSHG